MITKEDILSDVGEIAKKFSDNSKREMNSEEIFYNFCFTLLAPQMKFSENIKIVEKLKELDFYSKDYPEKFMWDILRTSRFYRMKLNYLLEMKKNFNEIESVIKSEKNWLEKRSWLRKNVKGMGLKASSHCLRNLGAIDLAIIDTHVLKFLNASPPKNDKEYILLEEKFKEESNKLGVTVSELDAYVWKKYAKANAEDFVY